MEVGCTGTWGLEVLAPNPGSKSTPKACLHRNPATSPTIPSPSSSTCHAEPGAPVILLPLRPASLRCKNPQGRKIIHGMRPAGRKE